MPVWEMVTAAFRDGITSPGLGVVPVRNVIAIILFIVALALTVGLCAGSAAWAIHFVTPPSGAAGTPSPGETGPAAPFPVIWSVLIAVLGLLVAGVIGFIWGVVSTMKALSSKPPAASPAAETGGGAS